MTFQRVSHLLFFFLPTLCFKKEKKTQKKKKLTDSLEVKAPALLRLAVRKFVERDLGVALVHLDPGGALVGLRRKEKGGKNFGREEKSEFF